MNQKHFSYLLAALLGWCLLVLTLVYLGIAR